MRKYSETVWTIQLPNRDIHININVDESDIREFVKGKGEWGTNALYLQTTESLTIFDSIGETENQINYLEQWDRSLNDILSNTTEVSELNAITYYVNIVKDGLLEPNSFVILPDNPPSEKTLALTKELNANFDELDEQAQEDLILQTELILSKVTSTFK